MKPQTMIFDQYSRYKACSDLIRQTGFIKNNSILDIGSGPECLFGQFMPEAAMSYIDPLIPFGSGEGRITGNVFSSELDGRAFDYVSAVDVLEHVPPEHRKTFLERISSLASNFIILGFPASDSTNAAEVDNAIEERYREIFNQDYSWLEEHFRYGLPSLSHTVDQLTQLGWHCQTIGHGHAPWLQELLGFVVCAWDFEFLQKTVLDLSEVFNKELYPYDFQAPFYRQFLIASRNPLPEIGVPTEAENDNDSDHFFDSFMLDAYRKYFKESMLQLNAPSGVSKERDAAIAERDNALAERDKAVAQVDEIWKSRSWKITRPLRIAARIYRHGILGEKGGGWSIAMRSAYHRAPLPDGFKKIIRFIYHRVVVRVISSVRRVLSRDIRFRLPSGRPAARSPDVQDYIMWGVVDWYFRFQRPQQLAKSLAKTGRRVFYISPVLVDDSRAGFDVEALDKSGLLFQVKLYAKGAPSIYASAPGVEVIAQLRASIGEVLDWADSQQVISLVQHPYWFDFASVLPNSRLVYDCMDHHEGFGNTGESLMHLENTLFNKADLTITTSDWLNKTVDKHVRRHVLIRNAGEYEYFSKVPGDIYSDPQGRKIIGYYGAIAEWFDVDLVEAIARRFTNCRVLLIGTDTINARSRLRKLSNVMFTGEVPYEKLPYYLHGFDVCVLPFKVVPLTLATNPVKVYEYLSAGKPVVTVNLPEMAQFDELVYVASEQEYFLSAIGSVLSKEEHADLIQRRKEFAGGQTWEHRARTMMEHAESSSFEPKVSVVVVTYNNFELTKSCLYSLEEYSQYQNMEIIVVDNASTDETPSFLEDWAAKGKGRELILNDQNLGFAAANNQGLNIATGDYLVMLNNDTYVTPGWIRTLIGHLNRDNSIGLIGPVTNNIGNEAKIDIQYADMNEMLVESAAYTRRHIGQVYPLRTAAFFCVMLRRDVYQKVGPLDEAFGIGFFEDDDYCRRLESVGLRVVCAEDVFVHHHLSASFSKLKQKERQRLFQENKILYEKKWGEWVPHGYRKSKQPAFNECSPPHVFEGQEFVFGQCNVCGQPARFYYNDEELWRESLNCEHCRTTSRYRSIARGILRAIEELTGKAFTSLAGLPGNGEKTLRIYDTQPPFYYEQCSYPIPDLLKAANWIDVELSQFRPDKKLGVKLAEGVTNQNLERLTFSDSSLDVIITSDVMEHVRLDGRAHKEIYRVLKPGGVYIFTVPHNREWDETLVRVQICDPDDPSKDVHLLEPEYHGDTNNEDDAGVLAYRTYGKDLEKFLQELGFTVEYSRYDIENSGIMNTELYYCRKLN